MDIETDGIKLMNSLYSAMAKQYGANLIINLTRGEYSIKNITDELFKDFKESGKYSELDFNLKRKLHPSDVMKYEPFLHKNLLRYFKDGGEQIEGDYRLKCSDGNYHWIKTVIIKLYNIDTENGGIYAVYLSNIIDNQKQIEQSVSDALLAAEAAGNSKSEFLTRVSHDIRTPMNAIINLTAIIKNNIGDKEKALEYLNKLEVSSGYLLSLINNILDMSRIENGKMITETEQFDLRDFISDIKTIIAPQLKKKNQKLKITENNIVSRYLLGDALRLKQIIINLLSNAAKFTSNGGTITFGAEQKILSDNHSRVNMIFTVSDTGIGMSKKLIKDVFKPFVQGERSIGSYEGSGLGLSIVHNLVQIMNGTINVYSELGIGTEFVTEIPLEISGSPAENTLLADDKKVSEKKIPENKSGEKKSFKNPPSEKIPEKIIADEKVFAEKDSADKNLLLAEDDFINAEIAALILGERGFNVDTVSNGEEAVIKFNSSPLFFYKGVLMDLQMPVMDGYEATLKIRALPRGDASEIPIIALSANTYIEDVAAAKAAGMNAHVAKPINADALYETLDRFIGGRLDGYTNTAKSE